MPNRKILLTLAFFMLAPHAVAASMTDDELNKASSSNVVEHHTTKGVIICRDPQIEYSEQDWLRIGGPMGEHMLVDTIVGKKLLGKQRAFVDSLFKRSLIDVNGPHSLYNFYSYPYRCGNTPALRLEAIYNQKGELIKYRSRTTTMREYQPQ